MDLNQTFHTVRRRLNGASLQLDVAVTLLGDASPQPLDALRSCREELDALAEVLEQLEHHLLES